MLNDFKQLFSSNSISHVTDALRVTKDLVNFFEAQLRDPEKINAAIDFIKQILDDHKK